MRTFLDTNVLIAAFRGNNEASERALGVLDDAGRQFLGSDFLRLELLPKPTYESQDDERAFYETYLAAVVQSVETTPGHVESAFALATTHGLSAPDALLAQAAIAAQAAEFVTIEAPTKPLFRIPTATLLVRSLL